jgi:amidase
MSTAATDLRWAGLRAQADALARGDVGSAELVAAALERIAASDLGAFRVVRDAAARSEAADADRRLAAGERLPLLGVPVAVKDDTDVAGETTPFGCAGDFPVAAADAEAVRRLRAAGAIVVGKTTTPEFGQWPFTEGSFGQTRNPWDRERSPGGSSGGSAAAVAGGLVGAAVGSDGAGSVRIPAAWTHLVGLKPHRGRISTMPHPDVFGGLACLGPLARTVDDAALLLDVLAGNVDGDTYTCPAPGEPFAEAALRDPGPLRIALSFSAPFSAAPIRIHPEIREATRRIAGVLEELGHEIFEEDVAYGAVGPLFLPRSLGGIRDLVTEVADPDVLDHRTRANARSGAIVGARALRGLSHLLEGAMSGRIGRIFDRADVVLTPTTALPPTRIGAYEGLSGWRTDQKLVRACPLTYAWNMTGWPGLNVPAGFTARGLPIGVQLLGHGFDEARLLALGRQLEQVERWHERRPPA